jgi:hypothetical protein
MWARDVLADPATILVVMLGAPEDFSVRVEDSSGAVLLDKTIIGFPLPPLHRQRYDDITPTELPDWLYSQNARELRQRRTILISSRRGAAYYEQLLENETLQTATAARRHEAKYYKHGRVIVRERKCFNIHAKRGDDLILRHHIWLGEAALSSLDRLGGEPTHINPSFDDEAQLLPAAVIASARHDLQTMATTPLAQRQSKHAADLLHNWQSPEYRFFRRRNGSRFWRISEAIAIFGSTSTPEFEA